MCVNPSRSTTSSISPFGDTRIPCSPNFAAIGSFASTTAGMGRTLVAGDWLGRDGSGVVQEATSTASAAKAVSARITPISTHAEGERASELYRIASVTGRSYPM